MMLPANIIESGETWVPVGFIKEAVTEMKGDEITIATKSGESETLNPMKVDIFTEKAKLSIVVPTDLPNALIMPSDEEQSVFYIDDDFFDLMNDIKFAMANDYPRITLNGINILSDGNDLTLCATDGYWLKYGELNNQELRETDFDIIIPTETVNLISELKIKGQAEIILSKSMISIYLEYLDDYASTLTSKLTTEKFPEYKEILPETTITASFDKKELIEAIKVVGLTAQPLSELIKMTFKKNSVEFSSEDSDRDYRSNTEIQPIECTVTGEIEIGYKSILDILGHRKGDIVTLGFVSRNRNELGPALAFSITGSDETCPAVLIPLRLLDY